MLVTYNIKVPCATRNLKTVRHFIQNNLKNTSLPQSDLQLVVLAIDEVCANLFIHAHNCNAEQYIELRITDRNNGLSIEIHDQGIGFDIERYQTPDVQQVVKAKRAGGMGMILVKRIMDEIKFEQHDSKFIYKFFKATDTTPVKRAISV